ncbi:T9SS type A sorting domain-containing protein [Bacteroidota bacterium]
MKDLLLNKPRIVVMYLVFILSGTYLQSQVPVLKVDLNIGDRQEAEVNEPGYIPWPLSSPGSIILEGITFEFKNGGVTDSWYKAGVQTPNFARLVNDGILTEDIELHITGLQNGKHSLVTFHNTYSNPDNNIFSTITIYVNDVLVIDSLEPSNRVLSNDASVTAYMEFEVANSDPVVIRFQSDPKLSTTSFGIPVCGFHLNSSDPKKMARFQYPGDIDEHVNIDNDTLVFSWTPPNNTVSQDVYFGTNEEDMLLADTSSPFFLGNQTDTFFMQNGFYSMDSYYWRIDPINSDGEKTKGDVWYFKKRISAFPGAEGYGRYALGGRGGKVVYVTNLNDNGPGSFRNAVENDIGPRTILFAVSGLITLEDRLVIRDDYITLAGQTAPGKGVCFRWAPIGVTGDNLIVQNLRVRLGIGVTFDGMGLTGAENSIIDHCSISWTIDEAFSSRGAKNITLQRTLISEALNSADHSNYPSGSEHGYAASIGGDIGSFHHNLLAHCNGRNWSLAGGLDGNGFYAGKLDLFNNVVYNWGSRATDGGAHEVNFVANYYKPGTSTTMLKVLNPQYDGFPGTQQYYFAGNVMPGYFDESNQEDGRTNSGTPPYPLWVDEPFFPSEATIHTAREAYKLVLSDVGCTQPVFDDHDIRIVNETLDSTYTYRGSRTGKSGFPDSEKDVGGWEEYPGFLRSADWDTDLDGLPNWWEKVRGLDTNSASGDFSESNADYDKNGYTNLEEFLHWMGSPHYFIENGENIDIDLAIYTRGFTNIPVYTVSNVVNGNASIADSSIVNFTPSAEGLAEFDFTVTDAEGSSMSQKIGIYVGEIETDSAFSYTYLKNRPSTDTTTDPGDSTSNINNSLPISNINIYPNPVNELLNIDFESNKSSVAEFIIMDISGNIIFKESNQINRRYNSINIDINNFSSGLYFINIKTNTFNKTVKFIKK